MSQMQKRPVGRPITDVVLPSVRRLMKRAGFRTIRQVAAKAGLVESGLGKILRGERLPILENAVKLAKTLKVTVEVLLLALSRPVAPGRPHEPRREARP